MIAIKIMNNNIVSSTDETGHEIIVMGKGIGWQLKPGSTIDPAKVDKIFRMDTATSSAKLKKLFLEVNVESISISSQVVDYAYQQIPKDFNKNLIISLTDHIDFAIERFEKNIPLRNDLTFWIKKMFPEEFDVGQYAINLIKKELHLEMPIDEAAHIAMHIINAEMDGNMVHTNEITSLISTSLQIIHVKTGKAIDETSFAYERFLRHLLALAQRIIAKKINVEQNVELNQAIQSQFSKEYNIAIAIQKFIQKDFHFEVNDDEVTFLTIHIHRLLKDT